MVKYSSDLKQAILLLRFHSKSPANPDPAYSSYTAISKCLKVQYNRVQHICRQHFKTIARINK